MNLQVHKLIVLLRTLRLQKLKNSKTYKLINLKTQKGAGRCFGKYAMISNSYDSANCIRFEGMISARRGTPLSLSGKDKEKNEISDCFFSYFCLCF